MSALPGASLVIARLADYADAPGRDNVVIHLAGHSAGSVFQASMLQRLADAGLRAETMSWMAPDITRDEINGDLAYGRADWIGQLVPAGQAEPIIAWGKRMLVDTSYSVKTPATPAPRLADLRADLIARYPQVGPISPDRPPKAANVLVERRPAVRRASTGQPDPGAGHPLRSRKPCRPDGHPGPTRRSVGRVP